MCVYVCVYVCVRVCVCVCVCVCVWKGREVVTHDVEGLVLERYTIVDIHH